MLSETKVKLLIYFNRILDIRRNEAIQAGVVVIFGNATSFDEISYHF